MRCLGASQGTIASLQLGELLFLGLVGSSVGVAFAWLAQELGGQGSVLLYISIFSVAIVAGALTFIPGGLGGTEVVLYMLAVATGMGEVEALTATILIRLTTLWYAVILGSISLLWLESNPRSYVGEKNKIVSAEV